MASKSAIVTGGARGIGKTYTKVLLNQGYMVAILDLNETVGKETAETFCSEFGSGFCVFYKCDVTKTEDLKSSYEETSKTIGQPSVVVNNAGISDEINWSKMIDINLKAMMDMTYIACDNMRKDKGGNGGTVINVSSELGTTTFPGFQGYVASKWGVIGFTQSMVASLALAETDWGVTLHTLCPGLVATDLTNPWYQAENAPAPIVSPRKECQQFLSNLISPNVTMSLDEIGSAFEKLLKDRINGSVMSAKKVDGKKLEVMYIEQKWTEVKLNA